jgi:putative flippase GtrA
MPQMHKSVPESVLNMKYTGHAVEWRYSPQAVESLGNENQPRQQLDQFRYKSRMKNRLLRMLPQGFPAFVVVGGIGFIVDASILATLVHGYNWGDYTARLMSFAIAVTATWFLNRSYVFAAARTHNRRSEYTRYLAVQGIGMAINFLVYSLCIISNPLMDQWPVLALAVGSVVALAFNYAGARIFVFTGNPD